jgi:E3 ubiquitin-protein ligase RNF115/126
MGDSPKVECTICIDEMHLGDEVTVLPCKHWFHGECVILWLKEHNTCPICRTPIEKRGENTESGNNGNGDSGAGGGSGNQQSRFNPAARLGAFALFGGEPWSPQGGSGSSGPSGSQQQNTRGPRTPEDRERRLTAIRNLAGTWDYERSASDSSRHGGQRRDSWSPTSPGPTSVSWARDRSPTRPRARFGRTNSSGSGREPDAQAASRGNNNNNSSNSSGNAGGSSNPLSWIRDRITGSGGSANGNNSGRRRS